MKVLFLDIDGVCNSEDTFSKPHDVHFPIDPYMAFLVGKIKLDTECSVVLSSSWRYHPDSVKAINDRIVEIIDVTPNTRSSERNLRGHEIQDWLDAHLEVTKYAILDDDSDMLESQRPNLFQTSFKTGLTKEIAQEIIKHLSD